MARSSAQTQQLVILGIASIVAVSLLVWKLSSSTTSRGRKIPDDDDDDDDDNSDDDDTAPTVPSTVDRSVTPKKTAKSAKSGGEEGEDGTPIRTNKTLSNADMNNKIEDLLPDCTLLAVITTMSILIASSVVGSLSSNRNGKDVLFSAVHAGFVAGIKKAVRIIIPELAAMILDKENNKVDSFSYLSALLAVSIAILLNEFYNYVRVGRTYRPSVLLVAAAFTATIIYDFSSLHAKSYDTPPNIIPVFKFFLPIILEGGEAWVQSKVTIDKAREKLEERQSQRGHPDFVSRTRTRAASKFYRNLIKDHPNVVRTGAVFGGVMSVMYAMCGA